MNLDEMRRLDALKTYKELEEAKKTINDLNLRVKHDFETILKFKAENQRLTNKIEQLYEGAEEQNQRIKRLEEALSFVTVDCGNLHHCKKHRHKYGEPCPVVALIEEAREAKP